MKRVFLVAVFTLMAAVSFAHTADKITVDTLISSQKTILGQDITYLDGDARMTMAVITIPAGQKTAVHVHDVPMVAYMLEGELTVHYGTKGTRIYKKGEGLFEAVNWPHFGINNTTRAAKVLVVYLGNTDSANARVVERLK